MAIDLTERSKDILTRLANSLHERNPESPVVFFSNTEIELTKEWLSHLIAEGVYDLSYWV